MTFIAVYIISVIESKLFKVDLFDDTLLGNEDHVICWSDCA